MEIILSTISLLCSGFIAFIAWAVIAENQTLKAQRNELERENLVLTTRLNQLKIDMEV